MVTESLCCDTRYCEARTGTKDEVRESGTVRVLDRILGRQVSTELEHERQEEQGHRK